MVSAPVLDETGLKAVYDIRLEWSAALAAPGAAAAAEPDVSLFTAVREQLGLRLEPIKTPVEGVEQTPTPD